MLSKAATRAFENNIWTTGGKKPNLDTSSEMAFQAIAVLNFFALFF